MIEVPISAVTGKPWDESQACSSGYTCSNCGQWVANNIYHYCNYNPQPAYWYIDRSQEIVDLLKQILEAVKN